MEGDEESWLPRQNCENPQESVPRNFQCSESEGRYEKLVRDNRWLVARMCSVTSFVQHIPGGLNVQINTRREPIGAVMNGYVINNLRFADVVAATTENQQELQLIVDNTVTETRK